MQLSGRNHQLFRSNAQQRATMHRQQYHDGTGIATYNMCANATERFAIISRHESHAALPLPSSQFDRLPIISQPRTLSPLHTMGVANFILCRVTRCATQGCSKIGLVTRPRLRYPATFKICHGNFYFQRELGAGNRGRRGPIGSLYPQGTRTPGVGLMIEFPWYIQSSRISQPGACHQSNFATTRGTLLCSKIEGRPPPHVV